MNVEPRKPRSSIQAEVRGNQYKTFEQMAEAAIEAGIAEYSVKGTGEKALPSLEIKRIYENDKKWRDIVNAIRLGLTQLRQGKMEYSKALLGSKPFNSLPTDHVLLLHKFVSKRDVFIKTHQFVDAKKLAKIMGIQVNNLARKIQSMRKRKEILFVKMGNNYLYPEFQFDTQGRVFDALINALGSLYAAGRTGWDICFWLFSAQSILLRRSGRTIKFKGLSFEAMMNEGKRLQEQAVYQDGTPFEALQAEKTTIFNAFVQDWLDPDNRELPVEEQAID